MNLRECFDFYSLDSLQIRVDTNGVELVCIVNSDLSDEAYDNIRNGVDELLGDPNFIDNDYDYLSGHINLEGDTIILTASQYRDIYCSKDFRTPVLT